MLKGQARVLFLWLLLVPNLSARMVHAGANHVKNIVQVVHANT